MDANIDVFLLNPGGFLIEIFGQFFVLLSIVAHAVVCKVSVDVSLKLLEEDQRQW